MQTFERSSRSYIPFYRNSEMMSSDRVTRFSRIDILTCYCWTTWILFFFYKTSRSQQWTTKKTSWASNPVCKTECQFWKKGGQGKKKKGRHAGSEKPKPTFHFSISSCCRLYCFTKSSRTFLSPSELVLSAGMTSLTVRSTKTPLIMRKHFRSGGRGFKVSRTSLCCKERGQCQC